MTMKLWDLQPFLAENIFPCNFYTTIPAVFSKILSRCQLSKYGNRKFTADRTQIEKFSSFSWYVKKELCSKNISNP